MAQPQEIHVADIGTVFKVTVYDGDDVVNLSSATELILIFKKSNKTLVRKTATRFTDGTDGIMQYTTVAGDLDVAGAWKIQAEVTFTGGQWFSNVIDFTVFPNLK